VAAAGLTGAGLLAAGTAAWLAGTGTLGPHGMIDIPALHDAASDRPLQYTPVCSRTAIPVCFNPAYARYLPATANALAPVLNQIAGLPGAPARLVQEPVTYGQDSGNGVAVFCAGQSVHSARVFPVVLADQLPGPAMTAAQIADQAAMMYAEGLVSGVTGAGPAASPAQNAVARAIMTAAGMRGSTVISQNGQVTCGTDAPGAGRLEVAPGTPAYAAAERFAALPAPARHAWLVRHIAALRAGQITLEQIP
jgi:hypothetical protein